MKLPGHCYLHIDEMGKIVEKGNDCSCGLLKDSLKYLKENLKHLMSLEGYNKGFFYLKSNQEYIFCVPNQDGKILIIHFDTPVNPYKIIATLSGQLS